VSLLGLLACSGAHLNVGSDPGNGGGGGSSGGGSSGGGPSGSTGIAGAGGAAGGATEPPPPTPADRIVEFPSALPSPNVIASGPDGNLWFTNNTAPDTVGSVTPGGLPGTLVLIGNKGDVPTGIVTGPDGNLWLAESPGSQSRPSVTGASTSAGFNVKTFPLDQNATPRQITAGSDGNIWFSDPGRNAVGCVVLASNGTYAYPITSAASGASGITSGPDGALWMIETQANRIARVATDGSMTEWPLPTPAASAQLIATGPDGALWFTEAAANKIGRATTTGAVTEYDLPRPNSTPMGIAAGPDGAVWFTESTGHAIGRMLPGGAVTEYALPRTDTSPVSITVGPDGNLWFTDDLTPMDGFIGRLTPESKPFTRLGVSAPSLSGCPSATQSVDVANTGDTPSGKLTVDLDSANPARARFQIADGCSGVALSPGDHCGIDVSLTSTATPAGPFSITITIKPERGDPYSVSVTGHC
jgi:virginiamycin B lyase